MSGSGERPRHDNASTFHTHPWRWGLNQRVHIAGCRLCEVDGDNVMVDGQFRTERERSSARAAANSQQLVESQASRLAELSIGGTGQPPAVAGTVVSVAGGGGAGGALLQGQVLAVAAAAQGGGGGGGGGGGHDADFAFAMQLQREEEEERAAEQQRQQQRQPARQQQRQPRATVGTAELVDERPLPPNWTCQRDEHGRMFFVNHSTKTTTWEDPRGPMPKEKDDSSSCAVQ